MSIVKMMMIMMTVMSVVMTAKVMMITLVSMVMSIAVIQIDDCVRLLRTRLVKKVKDLPFTVTIAWKNHLASCFNVRMMARVFYMAAFEVGRG